LPICIDPDFDGSSRPNSFCQHLFVKTNLMNKSEQLLDLARQAHRRATEEPSLRRGVDERRLARYFEQLAEAQAWLEKRRGFPLHES
jgi:hypothetical protein